MSSFVNAVILYVALLFFYEKSNPRLLWLIPLAILITPVYGWIEYRAARQRNQSGPARAAKVLAIVILVVNGLLLASIWFFFYTFEHGDIR